MFIFLKDTHITLLVINFYNKSYFRIVTERAIASVKDFILRRQKKTKARQKAANLKCFTLAQ